MRIKISLPAIFASIRALIIPPLHVFFECQTQSPRRLLRMWMHLIEREHKLWQHHHETSLQREKKKYRAKILPITITFILNVNYWEMCNWSVKFNLFTFYGKYNIVEYVGLLVICMFFSLPILCNTYLVLVGLECVFVVRYMYLQYTSIYPYKAPLWLCCWIRNSLSGIEAAVMALADNDSNGRLDVLGMDFTL